MREVAQLASATKAKSPAAPVRPRRQAPAAALQQRLGNRGAQHALEGRLPVAPARDPAELEAQRVAAQVATGRCACGGVAPPGGECAACRARRLGVQRSARGPAAATAPPVVERAVQEPGRALEPPTRSLMEAQLGHHLDGVRVHDGGLAPAAAHALSADAFTVGSDVVFAEGRYRPGTSAGRELLAHELVHVVQQSLAGRRHVARQARPGAKDEIATFDAFQKRVFESASARLDQNVSKLDEWRAFIDKQFSALGLRAQIGAGEALRLYEQAQARGMGSIYEHWAGTKSPASRTFDEAAMGGKINSGCQYCHESNVVWAWNAKHQREFKDLPTTAQRLSLFADEAELERVVGGAAPRARPLAPFAPGAPAATGAATAREPALVKAPAVPAAIVYPARRSTLCGALPDPKQAQPAPFDPKPWGPNSALALQTIGRIGPMLEPLGPSGYRVLPEGLFSTLYNRSPAQLQDDVRRNIADRQGSYQRLKQLIAAGKVDYDELCPIVDELLPQASPKLRTLIVWAIEQAQADRKLLDTLMAIVGAALMLLGPIFPPAFILGATVVTSGAAVVTGAIDYRAGSVIEQGLGAGVFSPEQEAQAAHLKAGGAISIAGGALGLATAGFGVAGLMRSRASVPRTGLGDGKFRPLADGSYFAVHPQNQRVVVFLEGDRMTAGFMAGDDFVALATAKSPWGGGPPPGTPTWAEWTAQRGWATAAKTAPATTALARRPTSPPAVAEPARPAVSAAPAVRVKGAPATAKPPTAPLARTPPKLKVAGSGPGHGRHRLQVLSDGSVTRCSAYCTLLLDQFNEELAVRTELREDLIALRDLYPDYVARHGEPAAVRWALDEARPIELRLERYRSEMARERAMVRVRPRGADPAPSWALRRENVPRPSRFEQLQVERYERALRDFHAARIEGRGERMARAVREMDAVEELARHPTMPEGVYLEPHIANLRALRDPVVLGTREVAPLVLPGGERVEVAGLAARDLPRVSHGRVPAPLTARVQPLAGKSYSQIERALGRPQQYQPDRHRITWHLEDTAMLHMDVPGPGAIAGQAFELNRAAHITKTLVPKSLTPPLDRAYVVSDVGTIVPTDTTPAHIPVTISPSELKHVEGLKLPSTPPKRTP